MKLAFSTLGCYDRSLSQIILLAVKNGISGIEVRGIGGIMDADVIPDFFPENIAATNRLMRDNNCRFICFGTSCNFHKAENYDEMLDKGYRAVDVCEKVGIPAIRVFGNNLNADESKETIIERVAAGIGMLCGYAEKHNVNVYLEVHGDFNSVETLGPVVKANEHYSNFGLIWDVEHTDRVYGDNWIEFYHAMKPYIKHIHIKNCKRPTDVKSTISTLIEDGDLPLSGIVKTLESEGYDGWYSLEWEKKWKSYLPELEAALPGFLELMK